MVRNQTGLQFEVFMLILYIMKIISLSAIDFFMTSTHGGLANFTQ